MALGPGGGTLSPATLAGYGNYALQQAGKRNRALPTGGPLSYYGVDPRPNRPDMPTAPTLGDFGPTVTQSPGSPATPGTPATFDPANSWEVQQYDALNRAQTGEMSQQTNDTVRQALLSSGSRDLALKYFGQGDPVLSAISEDPFTSTSQLGKENYNRLQNIAGVNNQAAQGNYFFGSARTHNLSDAERQSLFNRQDILNSTTSKIQQAYQQLAQFRMQQEMGRLAAQNQAYRNWIDSGGPSSGDPPKAAIPPQVTGVDYNGLDPAIATRILQGRM